MVHVEWCNILGSPNLPINADFFAAGGNSLMLMRLLATYQAKGFVNKENPITLNRLFENRTIAAHAKLLKLSSPNTSSDLCNTQERWYSVRLEAALASAAQQRIWLDEQVRFCKPTLPAMYNVPLAVVVGESDTQISLVRLQRAFLAVIRKHKILRTRIQNEITDKGMVIKQWVNTVPQHLGEKMFSEQLCDSEEQLQLALTSEVTQQYFSLESGHVIHCHIVRRRSAQNDEHLVEGDMIVFNIHHIAFDGASRETFFRDIQVAYEDEATFLATINDNELQYIDYSVHESSLLLDTLSTSCMTRARDYWNSTLKDCIDNRLFSKKTSTKDTDLNRVDGNLSFALSNELSEMMVSLAISNSMTLFQSLLACYQLFLHKITRQTDICVGGVAANRYRSELEPLIGMFVNILPYRMVIETKREITVHSFLDQVRLLCLDVLQHGQLPFQDIVQLHRVLEQQNQSPFFQTILILESYNSNHITCSFDGVPCRSIEVPMSVAKYDLSLRLLHDTSNNQITGCWAYSSEFFNEQEISTFSDRFISLLTQVADQQKQQRQSIHNLHVLQSDEQRMVQALTNTDVALDAGLPSCIAALFDARANEDPTRICVSLDNEKFTYAQIRDYSNRLASHLIERYNVQPGDIVMQCVQRSADMVIGTLSILKAHATYCALNPDHPTERHTMLIEDTRTRFVLCHDDTYSMFAWTATYERPLILINISTVLREASAGQLTYRSSEPNKPHDRAYIVFTSGSTGKPKAIPVLHSNFLTCIRACQHAQVFGFKKETVLQMSQCSFDVHVFELLGCMVTGGTLVMLKPFGNMDMDYLSRTIADQRVTWAVLTPSVIALLVQFLHDNRECANRLRSLCICGSAGMSSSL